MKVLLILLLIVLFPVRLFLFGVGFWYTAVACTYHTPDYYYPFGVALVSFVGLGAASWASVVIEDRLEDLGLF